MRNNRKQAAAALAAAAAVLAAGAFAPVQPRAAWWCTVFPAVPAEAVRTDGGMENGAVECRLWLADWLRQLCS